MRRLSLLALLFALASGASAQDRPGLGFAFVPQDAGLLVTALADDGPAPAAGLLEGDLITAVAGKAMAGQERDVIGQWIGLVGSGIIPVVLDVERADGPTQIEITPMPYSREALQAKVEARAAPPLSLPDLSSLGSTPEASAPPASGAGCIAGNCADGTGTWRYDSGATYAGAWRGGKRHGRGTFTFASGMAFTGDWVDDARVRGHETYASGATYEGEYAGDKRHGQGTYTFANGETFIGVWEDGARARGRETFTDGRVYEGEYADDKRHGQGTMTHADGRTETGLWRQGAFVGAQRGGGSGAAPEASGGFASALAEFDAAMQDSPTPRRASREGGRLVVRSERCTIEFPIAPTTQAEPSDTSALHFYIASANHDVTCGPTLSVSRRSNFDFASTPARDRALRAVRAVFAAWATGADTGPPPPVAAAPAPQACAEAVSILRAVSAEQVRCALAAGEDPNASSSDGLTPLSMAASANRSDVLRLLVPAGADLEAPMGGRLRMTVLMLALKQPSVTDATLRTLLDLGADPNARDALGTSPLYLAILNQRAGAVRLLLDAGADPAESFSSGKTLLDLALEQTQTTEAQEIVAALRGAPLRGAASPEARTTASGGQCTAGDCGNGTGTARYNNGDEFTGTFRDGRETRGRLVLSGGDAYEGDFNGSGKFHGEGTYTSTSGWSFTGDWAEGSRVRGRLLYASGAVYEGEFNGNERHGRGTMTYADGNRYDGLWREDQTHGQGTYTWTDGKVYTGAFENGVRSGHGVMTWPSGSRYEGGWSGDRLHGEGTYSFSNGNVYTGSYAEGQRNGQGTFTWTDGRVYTGAFVDGDRQGHGVMTWPDGNRYEGDWKADDRSGTGTHRYPDGYVFVGTWSEDKRIEGTLQSPGGTPLPVRYSD